MKHEDALGALDNELEESPFVALFFDDDGNILVKTNMTQPEVIGSLTMALDVQREIARDQWEDDEEEDNA